MDLNTTTGSSDTDDDTPPQKHLAGAKTTPKQPYSGPSTMQPIYKECLKNHAANLGSHSLDGCGEFLLQENTGTEPYMLTCGACGCHRNFHRKVDPSNNSLESAPLPPYLPPPSYPVVAKSQKHRTSQKTGQAYPASHHYHGATYHHRLMEGVSATAVATPETPTEEVSRGKKRFRTRFTPEQKEKMLAFAEKQGWTIRRTNEDSVEDFCNEVGVTREVFKVWMHNNKYTSGNKKNPNVAPNKSHLSTSTDGDGTSDDAPNQSHLSTSTGVNSNGGSANNENKKGDGSSSSA